MKTTKDLSGLFEQARKVVPEIPISEIQSLLESGKTTPLAAKRSFSPRRITTRLFNPLKILIMITTFAIVTTALLTFNAIEHRELVENVGPVESQKNEKPEIANIQTDKSLKQAITSEPKSLGIPVNYQVSSDGSNLKDTVFNGIILNLSKEELSLLGFLFDDEGYYYLNMLPDGSKMNCWSWQMNQDQRVVGSGSNYVGVAMSQRGGSFGFASGGFVNKVNKSALHDFDFYPVLTTDLNGENPYPISQVEAKVRNFFEYMNDTLVPVLFSRAKLGGYNTKDMLVWFKVSDSFFNLLDSKKIEQSRLVYNRARQMAVNQVPANRVMYDYSSTYPMPKTIRLKPEILECYGIVLTPDRVDYKFNEGGTKMEWWVDKTGIGVNNYTIGNSAKSSATVSTEWGIPLIITDSAARLKDPQNKKGRSPLIFAVSKKYLGNTVSLDLYLTNFDLMLPIQIDDPTASPFLQELIFWVYPTDGFFQCLPPDIAGPMKQEFNYQLKRLDPNFFPVMGGSIGIGGGNPVRDTFRMGGSIGIGGGDLKDENIEPVPCVYFTNLCESLPGMEFVNLYPNPATDKLNVDLVILHAKKIRFRVFDLGGRVIDDVGVPEKYPEGGQFKHQMDISKLKSGFYLLVMTDEEGAKLTRRFAKN